MKELSKRGVLIKTCTDMNVSANMHELIGRTIKYTRLSLGEEAAEAQARRSRRFSPAESRRRKSRTSCGRYPADGEIKTDDESNGRAGDSN